MQSLSRCKIICSTTKRQFWHQSPWPVLAARCRAYATATLPFDTETDVLIVGSGAAGLVAGIRAHSHGLRALVIEKSAKVGGASAYSGGGVWVPNNHVSRKAGIPDTTEDALRYMEATIKEGAPESTRERKVAFLENAPKMVKWLEDLGFRWRASIGYSDYHPDQSGASVRGRSIESQVFNMKKLGDWEEYVLTRPNESPIVIHTYEAASVMRPFTSASDFLNFLNIVLVRTLGRKLIGQHPAAMGKALVSRLLLMNKERGTEIWRSSPFVELITDGEKGPLLGAVVSREGKHFRVRAKRGVLLAAGGFAKNKAMREEYGPLPASTEWTSIPPGDTGDAISASMAIGAATALMGDAWWGPTLMQDNRPIFDVGARSNPHSIIVDSTGARFLNESESYVDAGHHQYARHSRVPAIPAYLILDSSHRRRYILGNLLPNQTPAKVLASSFLVQAPTIPELATKLGIDAAGLTVTVARFNEMARKGVDEDFGRGGNVYDRVYSDPKVVPNANLGPLERAPFYATKVFPGDLGTKGGLVTDERVRVLREDGTWIEGLYGAGNTTASIMGRRYPGPGSTLGPAMTFAFVAVDDVASRI